MPSQPRAQARLKMIAPSPKLPSYPHQGIAFNQHYDRSNAQSTAAASCRYPRISSNTASPSSSHQDSLAFLDRRAAQVPAVELKQVERA